MHGRVLSDEASLVFAKPVHCELTFENLNNLQFGTF